MASKRAENVEHAKRISEILATTPKLDPATAEKVATIRALLPDSGFLEDDLVEALRQNANSVESAIEHLLQNPVDSWATQSKTRKKVAVAGAPHPSSAARAAGRTGAGARGKPSGPRSETHGGDARSEGRNQGRGRSQQTAGARPERTDRGDARPARARNPAPRDATAQPVVAAAAAPLPPQDAVAAAQAPASPAAPAKTSEEAAGARPKSFATAAGTGSPQERSGPRDQRAAVSRGGTAPAASPAARAPRSDARPQAHSVQPPPKLWLSAALRSHAKPAPPAAPVSQQPAPSVVAPQPVAAVPAAEARTPAPVEAAPQPVSSPQPQEDYPVETHNPAPLAPEPIQPPQPSSGQFDIPLFTSGDAFPENSKIRFGSFHSNSSLDNAGPQAPSDHSQSAGSPQTSIQSLQAPQTFSSQPPQAPVSPAPPQSHPQPREDDKTGRHPNFGAMPMPLDYHLHPYMPPFSPVFPGYDPTGELMGIPPPHHGAPDTGKQSQAPMRMTPPPSSGSPPADGAPGAQSYHPSYPGSHIPGLPMYYPPPYGLPYPYHQPPAQFNAPYRQPPGAMPYFKPAYPPSYPASGTHSYQGEDMVHPNEYMYHPHQFFAGEPPSGRPAQTGPQSKSPDGSAELSQGPAPISQGQGNMRYDPSPAYPVYPHTWGYPNP